MSTNEDLDHLQLDKGMVRPLLKCNIGSELIAKGGLTSQELGELLMHIGRGDSSSFEDLAMVCRMDGKPHHDKLEFIAKVMREWFVDHEDHTLPCKAVMRIPARPNIGGRTLVVIEIRGDGVRFNQTYFHALEPGGHQVPASITKELMEKYKDRQR